MTFPNRSLCAFASAVALIAANGHGQEAIPTPQGAPKQQDTPARPARSATTFPDQEAVMAHVRVLADPEMEGRLAGSPGGQRAGMYVAEQFAKFGLIPPTKTSKAADTGEEGKAEQPTPSPDGPTAYHQKFDWMRPVFVRDATTKRWTREATKVACHNIVGLVQGSEDSDEYLVIGAHYDHLGKRGEKIYNGADDNASGVAGLLAIAQAIAIAEQRPRRTIYFVAFDAEEQGLRGAKHFARHPPASLQNCIAMINLDMIGRGKLLDYQKFALMKPLVGIPSTPAAGVLGTAQSPDLAKIARRVFQDAKLPLFAPEDFGPLRSVIEKQAAGRSDHAPFEARKIPFLFFSTSENDDYHQPTDTIDKIDPAALHNLSRAVHDTVRAIDARAKRPTFVETPAKKGEGRNQTERTKPRKR